MHAGDRPALPPTFEEMEHAGEIVVRFIEQALPHLTTKARDYLLTDPHGVPAGHTSQEALRLAPPVRRLLALLQRLESVLAQLDIKDNQPGYDLAEGRLRAAVKQRFVRHRACFDPIAQQSIAEAINLGAEFGDCEIPAAKEHRLRNRIRRSENALVEAIAEVERRLGIYVEASTPVATLKTELRFDPDSPETLAAEADIAPSANIENHVAPDVETHLISPETTVAVVDAQSTTLAAMESTVIEGNAVERQDQPCAERNEGAEWPITEGTAATQTATPTHKGIRSLSLRLVIPPSTLRLFSRMAVGVALGAGLLACVLLFSGGVAAQASVSSSRNDIAPEFPTDLVHWERVEWPRPAAPGQNPGGHSSAGTS